MQLSISGALVEDRTEELDLLLMTVGVFAFLVYFACWLLISPLR